jgi:hypothetical protein
MIPQGFYRARAQSAQFGTTPQKGTDFLRVVFAIVDGEQKGQQVTWDGYFTEKTTARTIDALKYCGCTFPNNDITDIAGLDTQDVQIEVEHNSYEKDGEPKTTARVKWVNSLAGGVSPELQMDAAKKASFKQRMMGQVVAAKHGAPAAAAAPNGTPPPAAKPAPAPAVADDDIPF